MKSIPVLPLAAIAAAILISTCTAYAAPPAAAPGSFKELSDLYLQGKLEDFSAALSGFSDAALTPAEKTDLAYLKKAYAECRPAWWSLAKQGKPTQIDARVFNDPCSFAFDPKVKGVSFTQKGGDFSITIGWPANDMDNPGQAEHGYTKGELADLGVWMNLGMAETWSANRTLLTTLKPEQNKDFQRYIDFRGCLSGVYGSAPRARRWGLFLFMLNYMGKYDPGVTIAGRRAIGALFIEEVVSHRSQYPSIKYPADMKDATEEKLAGHFRGAIEQHGWTLAEDRSLREALLTFADANKDIFKTQKLIYPNKLEGSLDPDADKPLRAKRDAWLKEQLAKPE